VIEKMKILNADITQRKGLRLFSLFFFVLMILSVSVSATWVNEWGEFGDDVSARQWVADENGLWSDAHYLSLGIHGELVQPLVIDLDNDTVREIIIHDSTFLQIYHYDRTEGLILMNAQSTVDDAVGQISVIAFNETDHPYIVGAYENDAGSSDEIIVHKYDSGTISVVMNRTIGTGVTIRTGLRCLNYSGTTACYFGAWDGVNSSIGIYSLTWNNYALYDVSGVDIFSIDNDGADRRATNVPLIWDLDKDGQLEVILISDQNNDEDEGFIVWDIVSASTDCSVDDISTNLNDAYIAGLTVTNAGSATSQFEACLEDCWDNYWFAVTSQFQTFVCEMECNFKFWSSTYGGGTSDVVVSYSLEENYGSTVASHSYLNLYNSNCGLSDSVRTVTDPEFAFTTTVSNVLYQDFVGDDNWEYCIIGRLTNDGGNDETVIKCFDEDFLDLIFEWGTGFGLDNDDLFIDEYSTIIGANMDTDTKMEIIVGGAIISLHDDNTTTYVNTTPYASSVARFVLPVVADLTDDRNVEIIGQSTDRIYVSSSTYENQPPSISLFRRNAQNPICVKDSTTELTIWADANLGDYTNDGAEDRERLIVEFPNGTMYVGDYHLSKPTVTFKWNQTGTYDILVYIQDEFNPDVFTDYVDTVQLIYSSNENICNEPSGDVVLSDDVLTSEEELQDEVDTFLEGFGLDLNIVAKLVVFLIILVILNLIVLNNLPDSIKTQGQVTMFVLIIVNVVGLIAGYLFGFVPMWVIFILVFVIVGVAVITFMRGTSVGGS